MNLTAIASKDIDRLKGIFIEIPGTELSVSDAALLSGLERAICGPLLRALEETRFLVRRRNGRFVRRGSDTPIFEP